jgi:hypothetical protein
VLLGKPDSKSQNWTKPLYLHAQDFEFGILRNKKGQAAVSVISTRNAKGFAKNPTRR